MEKQIKRINFKDFNKIDELVQFLIENDINVLIDEEGDKFSISDIDLVWSKYKIVFNEKRFGQ